MTGLKSELKARHLFTLAFGTIVGVGWITMLGHWLGGGGSVGAIIAFLLGGLLMITIGLCYAEASSMMPTTGGEVVYAHNTFGPAAGFAAGWVLTLIYVSVTAFEAISVGWIVTVLLPGVEGPIMYRIFGADVTLGSLGIGSLGMLVIGLLNYRGAKEAAVFQDLMTYGLVLVSVIFIAVGLLRGNPDHLQPFFHAGDLSTAFSGMMTVFVTTPAFFAGFNVLLQAVGEKSPDVSSSTVTKALLASIAGALVFYVLVILASSMTMPREQLLEFDLPAAAAFRTAFDSALLGNVVLIAGLLGLITTWNAVFFAGGRVLLALARSGAVPAILGAIHPAYGTPGRAIILVGTVGSVLMLLGQGAVGLIINTIGLGFALMFLTVTMMVIRLRISNPEGERPYRVPGGMLLPVIAAISATGMIVSSLWEHARTSDSFPPEWTVLIAWTAAGFVFWLLSAPRRRELSRSAQDEFLRSGT